MTVDLSTNDTLCYKQQDAIYKAGDVQSPQRKSEGKQIQTTETTPHGGLQMKSEIMMCGGKCQEHRYMLKNTSHQPQSL